MKYIEKVPDPYFEYGYFERITQISYLDPGGLFSSEMKEVF